jgi:hypothetical protein
MLDERLRQGPGRPSDSPPARNRVRAVAQSVLGISASGRRARRSEGPIGQPDGGGPLVQDAGNAGSAARRVVKIPVGPNVTFSAARPHGNAAGAAQRRGNSTPHSTRRFCESEPLSSQRLTFSANLKICNGYSSPPAASSSSSPFSAARIWSARMPEFWRIAASILALMSGLALRNAFAFSRPWPMRWLS